MDTPTKDNLDSILKKLPATEQEQLTNFINKQKRTSTLHQELIKQLSQEMSLNEIVLNAAGDGIIAVNDKHEIINLNPALANMFGYKVRELKGQNLNLLLPEDIQIDHPEHMRKFGEQPQALIAGNKKEDKLYGVHKTKGAFKVSIAISHGVKGNQKVYTGIVRDLTKQDRLEQENKKKTTELTNRTKELEGLYSLIKLREQESIPAIINKLFTEIVPKTTKHPEKAVTIIELDSQTYRSSEKQPVVALTSKLHNGTLTFGFTEGVFYGTEQHQKILDAFTGELDQTILKVKAEQRELQTERRAAMGELSAGIAHNVNNGLQIIQGYTQIALELSANKDAKVLLEKINNKTQELGANVRGILHSTNYKPSKSQFELFDLGELLNDYLTGAENPLKSEALRQGASVTINKQIGVDTYISGKKAEITLITQALIKNSIDSFLEDGSIDIDVSRKGNYIHLQVKDTGIGMNQETQKKLFEPYFTTKNFELGKGLSLSTAQKIAQEHSGEIKVLNSRMGQGTTIELKLPYAQHQEKENEHEHEHEPLENHEDKKKKQLRILWAEDDIIIQETVKMMTQPLEDQIDFVENGKIAMDMLQQRNYDVLITDIGMPVMGGWKLLKSIKGRYENMPRVVASGYIINSNDMNVSGANYLLNKPLQRSDITKILDKIKAKQQHSQRSATSNSLNNTELSRVAC